MADYEKLKAAVQSNDLMTVEQLMMTLQQSAQEKNDKNTFLNLRKSICIDALNKKNLPLLKLAFSGDIFLQSRAFDKEANIEMVNVAIQSNFVEGLEFLHTQGLALEYGDRDPAWSALLEATKNDKLEVLRFLLTLPFLEVNVSKNESVLMNASSRRSAPTLTLLSSNPRIKATINTPSSNGDVALHRCFDGDGKPEEDCLACVKALVQAGADVNLKAKSTGTSPFAMATQKGLTRVSNYLKENNASA